MKTEYGEKTLTYGDVKTNVYDFVMALLEGGKTYEFDYMVATPLMNMITAFKLVWTESRLGTSKFTKGKDDNGKPIKVDIKTFGLYATHLPWLTGITYPPERRTGLMKCLGALTLGINLITHKAYQDKALAAFNNSISHLDSNGEIGSFLSKTKLKDIGAVMSKLGDCLHLAGERSHRKMSFPLFAFMKAHDELPALHKEGNFSGIGGYRAYERMCKYTYSIRTKSASVDHVRQALFHAMFGTIFEDLGILAQITNVPAWQQRAHLDVVYKKSVDANTSAGLLDVKGLITFKKFSKLVSSNITPFGAGTLPQNVARATFAGNRVRVISKELKEYLKDGGQSTVFGATAHSIEAQLDARKRLILEMIDNKLTAGTVGWATGFSAKGLKNEWSWDGVTQDALKESGVYVYGLNTQLVT